MKQYLECLGISNEEAKVKVASQFITKDAKMWWRRKVEQIAHGYAEDISTWEEMKEALQTHFSPQDETWGARTKIKYAEKKGSLQAYQWEYASVVLELPDMAEVDKVFNFIVGLKQHCPTETQTLIGRRYQVSRNTPPLMVLNSLKSKQNRLETPWLY